MQTKYTPGPWAVTTVGSCHGVHPAASSNERDDICRIAPHNYHPGGWPAAKAEAEANARLIAAAPELLELVLDALDDPDVDILGSEWARDARAAIVKATGAA